MWFHLPRYLRRLWFLAFPPFMPFAPPASQQYPSTSPSPQYQRPEYAQQSGYVPPAYYPPYPPLPYYIPPMPMTPEEELEMLREYKKALEEDLKDLQEELKSVEARIKELEEEVKRRKQMQGF